MNPVLLAVVTLRAAALAASLAGRSSTASALYSLADLTESGAAVDSHMADVAAKLKDRELTDADWSDVANRIHADSARLHSG
jgi:hypothetical protein